MIESVNSKMFDLLLTAAFSKYEEKQNSLIPSDEELEKRYPLPDAEIRSVLRYQKRTAKVKKYGKTLYAVYLRRAVAIVLIAVSVLFGAVMLNEEVRAAVGKAIVQFFEKYVKIVPTGEDASADYESGTLSIYDFDVLSHIPEGYETVNVSETQTDREFEFVNENGYDLYVCVTYSDGLSVYVDNETSDLEKIEIDGNESYRQIELSEEPNFVSITVFKGNISLLIYGYERPEIMTEIAKEIIKQ